MNAPNKIIIQEIKGKGICYKFTYCYQQYLTAPMQELLQDPDRFLANSAGPFFKNTKGDTTTVGVVVLDGRTLVIKRYNIKGLWHFLKKCWRTSNAMITWKNVHYLKRAHIATLVPVACIEERFGILRGTAYFISEYIDGIRGCDYFCDKIQPEQTVKLLQHAVTEIVKMVKQMQNSGVVHRDFQWGNLLFVEDKPLLLDLDHMKIYRLHHWLSRFWFKKAFRHDLQHFLRFLVDRPALHKMFADAFFQAHFMD